MKRQLIFRMTAYTDAAGKFNPDAPNCGNEDNFFAAENLGENTGQSFSTDKEVELSECGMLMAIADGMGGMNAGEVASEIAIGTVKEFFAPGRVTPKDAKTYQARKAFLESIVREADRRIKKDSRENPEHEGMGSTIILAWLAGDELTVCWCGDSRAYRFNPAYGLQPLSKDHSYVQELADRGVITYEQTFDHPQGNIVTRSLGDPNKDAKPDTMNYNVNKSDIILLCSDGLSGVLRDADMQDIIAANRTSMQACREALWAAAEKAEWYDNVTTILCEILDGVPEVTPAEAQAMPRLVMDRSGDSKTPDEESAADIASTAEGKGFFRKTIKMKMGVLVGIVAVLAALVTATAVALLYRPAAVDKKLLATDTLTIDRAENVADSLKMKKQLVAKDLNDLLEGEVKEGLRIRLEKAANQEELNKVTEAIRQQKEKEKVQGKIQGSAGIAGTGDATPEQDPAVEDKNPSPDGGQDSDGGQNEDLTPAVPKDGETSVDGLIKHIVKENNETLQSIAEQYGVTLSSLCLQNNMNESDAQKALPVGTELVIRKGPEGGDTDGKGSNIEKKDTK